MSGASNVEEAAESAGTRSRREFLADVVMIGGAALGLGGLAFRFAQYLYPVVLPVKLVEVPAGKLEEIPKNGVRYVNLPDGPVMLESLGNEIRAFSAICTHLGCIVHWNDDQKKFICPCHGGVYDLDGKVLSGPPPRPLDKLDARVRSGDVFVMMKSQKEQQA